MTAGFLGFVTSTAVKFRGGDSCAIQSTRRLSRVSWIAIPSPQLPKPSSSWWASRRIFRADGGAGIAGDASSDAIDGPRRSGRDALAFRLAAPRAMLRHRLEQLGRHLRDVRVAAGDHAL